MKQKQYDFSSSSFPNDFWNEYDLHASYDALLKDYFILDEFLEEHGLKRISNSRYCNGRMGIMVTTDNNQPLPNLSR